jgi:hypothetical protein
MHSLNSNTSTWGWPLRLVLHNAGECLGSTCSSSYLLITLALAFSSAAICSSSWLWIAAACCLLSRHGMRCVSPHNGRYFVTHPVA